MDVGSGENGSVGSSADDTFAYCLVYLGMG